MFDFESLEDIVIVIHVVSDIVHITSCVGVTCVTCDIKAGISWFILDKF